MKKISKILAASFAAVCTFCACSQNELPVNQPNDDQMSPITRSATGIKNIVYIEVNDINPLNAGSYTMNGAPFFDYVILFASNIRGVGSDATLYHNPNVQYILDHKETLIKPLQDKGVKVLMGLLGDHTGLGFANMNAAQTTQFANAVANDIEKYGLDGVDFDDEWAEYGRNGYPSGSTGSFPKLITTLSSLPKMAGKTITVFNYGYTGELSGVNSKINYGIYAFFGYPSWGTGFGMPNSKWAPYTLNLRNYNDPYDVEGYARQVASKGYGAIGYYDLRASDTSDVLNGVAVGAFGSTCTYDGNSYPKNY